MSELDKSIRAAQTKNMTVGLIVGLIIFVLTTLYFGWLFITKGYVIQIMPQQAQATQKISVIEGVGFSIGGSVYRIGGNVKAIVGAVKFDPVTIAITTDSPPIINVTLKPSPGLIKVTTQPTDKNTMWSIDNTAVSIGSDFSYELQPGHHVLTAENKFHEPFITDISIESDEIKVVEAIMQPIIGSMAIKTTPSQAEVFVQTMSAGMTPLALNKTGGAYNVTVKLEGYEDITDVVEVSSSDRNPVRHYQLEPLKGYLNLSVSPSDGLLLFNGKSHLPGKHAVYSNQTHNIVYQKDGYSLFEKSAIVVPGEEKIISITLKPEYGSVTFNSSPAASIYINGQLKGEGSLKTRLSAVEYTVDFKRKGYRTIQKTFKPSAVRSTKIDVVMLTEFEARNKEGIPLYSETIGIKMLGFKPTRFTMGSAANESGRRRNEHQVPVTFSKSILVGKHEITEAQFSKFNGSSSLSKEPVTNISWNDAALYCNWLSAKDGFPAFYAVRSNFVVGINISSNGYRLPMEAEWEWLSKKYKRSKPTAFIWGDVNKLPKKSANIADASVSGQQVFFIKTEQDGFEGKAPVGSFKASRTGLYDLVGNVSEWVHDFHTYRTPKASNPLVDYMGPTSGVNHIYKGGNYKTGKIEDLRASYRETSDKPDPTIGFRVARYK
jgi:formylglycine-generating enzyme required for sulfatase activity